MLFKKISPEIVAWHNLAHRRAQGREFTAAGRQWRWQSAVKGTETYSASLNASWGQGEITLWLDNWHIAAATVLDIPVSAVSHWPAALALAALESFAGEAFAALEKFSSLPLTLTSLQPATTSPPDTALFFHLCHNQGLRLAGAALVVDKEGSWYKTLNSQPQPRQTKIMPLPSTLPLTGIITMAAWAWKATELNFAPGDVLLPTGEIVADKLIFKVGKKVSFSAQKNNGKISVEGKTMTAAATGANRLADTVEVELTAETGRITITLEQLYQLGIGQVVEFNTPVERPVALTVGGKAIATGELVDVGGRVGVRIIEISTQT